jgi:MFS family permease
VLRLRRVGGGRAGGFLRRVAVRPPGWWPPGIYYGWALVGTLGITATVSYGILYYGFSVFISPMSAEMGWSKTQITGAFSIAQLVAGVAAIPAGRWIDRHGSRALMTAGSVLAAATLAAWSFTASLAAFYMLMAVLGIAMAAVLYEPAFAVVATWFRRDRGRALTLLTFIGGFASVIFVPFTSLLVSTVGWREALLWLSAVMLLLTGVPHASLLRRRPADLGLEPDGSRAASGTLLAASVAGERETSVVAPRAVRSPAFRWLTAAFALSAFSTTAVSVHLVPLLLERGYDLRFAGAAMGVLGLMALPGRLVFTPLGDRRSRTSVTAMIFALQAAGIVALLASRSTASVWAFVILFGAGFGAITPARAALVAELFGSRHYGRISGVLTLILSLARAAAPVGASLLHAAGGRGYDTVIATLLFLSAASGGAVLLAAGETVSVTTAKSRAG